MEDLKQEIKELDKQWQELKDKIDEFHQQSREKTILRWIQENVKEGMIFWLCGLQGYNEELEFKKVEGTKIVFWNKTFNKKDIFTPLGFLNLEKEELVVSAKSPDFCRISEPNIIVEGSSNRNMILCEY